MEAVRPTTAQVSDVDVVEAVISSKTGSTQRTILNVVVAGLSDLMPVSRQPVLA